MAVHNLSGSVSEQANASDSVAVGQVFNFAWQHLKAATMFRDRTAEIEKGSIGTPLGDYFVDVRSYASATILSAVASVEALANELFISHQSVLRSKYSNFEDEYWGKNGIERMPILKKYDIALAKLGHKGFDTNSTIYKNAGALVQLRNSLMHYKPTWDPDTASKTTLVQYLQGKYALSPFIKAPSDFLTMQSMSAGCAEWAIKTVFEFLHEFDSQAKIEQGTFMQVWKLEC